MKVFVTGHLGYIGVHLVEVLREAGHRVTGCDVGLFEGCAWERFVPPHRELRQDVRSVTRRQLEGHDCVMHLAALSNDPMGALAPGLTEAVNVDGSVRLARLAKEAGVPRFLFSGSCSVYGKASAGAVDEESPLLPQSAYARSKAAAEAGIAALADERFHPVLLRNATAYGASPMLRLDLVVNELLAQAVVRGEIRLRSDGSSWRPLVHCRDVARAFLALAEAPVGMVHGQVVNVGSDGQNHTVRDLAHHVRQLVPEARLELAEEAAADPRSYRVRFGRLRRLLPDFRMQTDLDQGLKELHGRMVRHRLSAGALAGDRFVRLRRLEKRLRMLRGEGSGESRSGS